MDFALTEEQKAIQEVARRFTRERLIPNARAWDIQGTFHRELLNEMAELGFLGVPIPEKYGGLSLRGDCVRGNWVWRQFGAHNAECADKLGRADDSELGDGGPKAVLLA